ncbi:MAG: ATP-dependent helicase [Planctomycetes bacterium]|nr:ATP-dependent helicase [Planctomycetota bacterium]
MDGDRFVPDDDQRLVIDAEPSAMLLVTAPPGAGKTAVACARIAALARRGVPPARIMMLSFTRTAVAEFRDRIEALAADVPGIRAVEITTLDANVWRLLKGFDESREIAELFGDYDANIEGVLARIGRHEENLIAWLQQIRHLVVDEAQDLVGSRARLVLAILQSLAPDAGATVFADEAQAIYGFTAADDEGQSGDERTFLDLLAETPSLKLRPLELRTIHRTRNPLLREMFRNAREPFADAVAEPGEVYQGVRIRVEEGASATVDQLHKNEEFFRGLGDGDLVLFRRRVEVLLASATLCSWAVEHRVRMPRSPMAIEPWIGFLLGAWTERHLDHGSLTRLWEEHAGHALLEASGRTPDSAWRALLALVPERRGRITMRELRSVLSRSRPPVEVAVPECGTRGVVLSTIHASKGREAQRVVLMLPRSGAKNGNGDYVEEGKVLYVGATRAVRELVRGVGMGAVARRLDSGRVYHPTKPAGSAQVEIGRDGDLERWSPVSQACHGSAAMVQASQSLLAESVRRTRPLHARILGDGDFRYLLTLEDDRSIVIGRLDSTVNHDLFHLCERISHRSMRPPMQIKHVFLTGVTTACLPEDDPMLERLFEPWSRSGIWLAPIVRAFPKVWFERKAGSCQRW